MMGRMNKKKFFFCLFLSFMNGSPLLILLFLFFMQWIMYDNEIRMRRHGQRRTENGQSKRERERERRRRKEEVAV